LKTTPTPKAGAVPEIIVEDAGKPAAESHAEHRREQGRWQASAAENRSRVATE